MLDYHMHTYYSTDGKMTMDEACSKAIASGLKEICFTDHMDIGWIDGLYQIKDFDSYLSDIEKMQARYKNRLTVKTGIEMGLKEDTMHLSCSVARQYPFDFIIASVHLVNEDDPFLPKYYEHRDKTQSYTDYYKQILDLICKYDDFCVLGHLDYVRRYCPYPYEKEDHLIACDLVDAILKLLISKGKGIEVNTSGYRHESQQPLPHPDTVKRYRELGGEIITIGSDSHIAEHVGFKNSEAVDMIKNAGFSYITSFNKMKPEFKKI